MSMRIKHKGRCINPNKPLTFYFNGRAMRGFDGDSLASALLANDQMMVGRSFKYHRPRGIVSNGPEEPNALFGTGSKGKFVPNQRASSVRLYHGLEVYSQNHWPSLHFDIAAINNMLSRFLPAGFYYKTFIHPRIFWKYIYEPVIRRISGLGKAPTHPDEDSYEHFYYFVDVLIIGGGMAGVMAAKTAVDAGAKVLLVEQRPKCGGQMIIDGEKIDGNDAEIWIKNTLENLENKDNFTLKTQTTCAGIFDHGYGLCVEKIDNAIADMSARRERLWRVRAQKIITAAGAIERPLCFPGNDIPGIFLAGAARDYLTNYGVGIGQNIAIVTNNDSAYKTALSLKKAGLSISAIIDARAQLSGTLPHITEKEGIRIYKNAAIAHVYGKKRVRGAKITKFTNNAEKIADIACDAIAMSGGWSPTVHHWAHTGGKLLWDEILACFRPDHDKPPLNHDGTKLVIPIGACDGNFSAHSTILQAQSATLSILKTIGFKDNLEMPPCPKMNHNTEAPLLPVWLMPENASYKMRKKIWVDYQNDVKATDIELAAREGYESVEHTKRYTTLGMATDQGKLSNINGLALLSKAMGNTIPNTGTTTFRPPYSPITLGAIAGEAHNNIFQPTRRSPLHEWHDENGAYWEPVSTWRRPYTYLQKNEEISDAVTREVLNTRTNIGLLDASTLGKLIVKGKDAGKFLDMLYTNMMSNLKIGQCRYGLMCNENGFLMDDGVVVRLDEESFLCHTTTGGADTIHAHMEKWLQTQWWDWKVWVLNASEQFAQIGIAGPKARKLLEKIGVMDVSAQSLPFMHFAKGKLGGIEARVFRISFSGELSYEIAVPSSYGLNFWKILYDAGQEFGIMPYGTEALHVMRAEKGFIMIGDETDGTVTPQDLGLNWLISRKKDDYIGKRAQARAYLTTPDRWHLVGLKTLDGSVLAEGAYAFTAQQNQNNQQNVIGRVTSTYYSPTLGYGIALGLVQKGKTRMGEIVNFSASGTKKATKTQIISPIFYDIEGTKQNV